MKVTGFKSFEILAISPSSPIWSANIPHKMPISIIIGVKGRLVYLWKYLTKIPTTHVIIRNKVDL